MNFVPCLEHVLNLRELHQEESLNSPWILCLRRWGNPDTLHVSVNLNNLIYHGVLLVPACSIVGVFVAQLKRPVKEKSSTIHGQIKSMKDCWALRRRAFDAADWHFCICHVIHRLHTSLNTLCTSPTIIFPFLSFSFTVLIYHISFFFLQSCEHPLDSSWVLYWLLSVLCLSLCSCSAAVSKITPAGPTPPGTPPTTTQCLTPAVKTTPPPSAPADWISRTCSTQRYPTHEDAYCFLNETKIKSAESNRLPPPMGEKKMYRRTFFFWCALAELVCVCFQGCEPKLDHLLQGVLSYAMLVILGFAIIKVKRWSRTVSVFAVLKAAPWNRKWPATHSRHTSVFNSVLYQRHKLHLYNHVNRNLFLPIRLKYTLKKNSMTDESL